jgi:hypothetical protein
VPYIEREKRIELVNLTRCPVTAGELNFCITDYINWYVSTKGMSYQTINDVIGACEGAKLEFVRRFMGKYEDQKRIQNGDVYDFQDDK